jgi:hypothetical protein
MKKETTNYDALQGRCLAVIQLRSIIFIVHITKRVGEKISFTKLFKIVGQIRNAYSFWSYREREHLVNDYWNIGSMKLTDFTSHEAEVQTIKKYSLIQDREKELLERVVRIAHTPLEQAKTAVIKECSTFELNMNAAGLMPQEKI